MTKEADSDPELFAAPTPPVPPERASESVISGDKRELLMGAPPPAKPTSAISSAPFDIGSIAPPESNPALPSLTIEDAMNRGKERGMPLSKLVAVGAAIFLVLVALIWLLLFR